MREETINTIIEGCFPDTPGKLMYGGIELEIPAEINCILFEDSYHPIRYILYERAENNEQNQNFSNINIINNPFFESYEECHEFNKIKSGWPIRKFEPNFRWIFDAQRSIVTRDKRIYVSSTYFEKDWRWYLNAVPRIFKECEQIFSGEKTEGYFEQYPSNSRI